MSFTPQLHLDFPASVVQPPTISDFTKRRCRALRRIDRELSRRNFKAALSLLRHLRRQPDGLRAFGTAKQVPKKLSSLDELIINGVDLSYLKPTVDLVTDSIKSCMQCSLQEQVSSEGFETDLSDEIKESSYSYEDYHFLCIHHEAGHFLIGYLLGILPKGYKIPSMTEFWKGRFAAGSVDFAGFDSLESGVHGISNKTLNNFSCVVLGGLVAEQLQFGCIEGLHSDVDKLDKVLRWLGYSGSQVDDQVRWAALNTVSILHRHNETRSRLAEAMALGRSIGQCIDTIEKSVVGKEI
ncbi:uncharacterized protein LOC111296279 [Durio zibethinus]|uniref:Uncharacterized protein LOC111296279 n=1 Tax=Durio zibethinus TaxID=66656 RepID=A0A6P5Z0A7_DURZI|nr:uncharacterized protein LOC111296279 [Durio zibethinus]